MTLLRVCLYNDLSNYTGQQNSFYPRFKSFFQLVLSNFRAVILIHWSYLLKNIKFQSHINLFILYIHAISEFKQELKYSKLEDVCPILPIPLEKFLIDTGTATSRYF